ncbi:hypothetical protein, partial [Marivita sp.]|uniref:hypothetical protein n=1 Tax=Marivita sp. TaxID=2003365 RepID=UPI00321A414E
ETHLLAAMPFVILTLFRRHEDWAFETISRSRSREARVFLYCDFYPFSWESWRREKGLFVSRQTFWSELLLSKPILF